MSPFSLDVPKKGNVTFVLKIIKCFNINIRCGHVVRDFESEAKTRCNF